MPGRSVNQNHRLTLIRCAFGVLLIGLSVRIVGNIVVSTLGMLVERMTAPGAGEGAQGYIGTMLLSVQEVFIDRGYLKWFAPSLVYFVGLVVGILLIRGPRFLIRPIRSVMA